MIWGPLLRMTEGLLWMEVTFLTVGQEGNTTPTKHPMMEDSGDLVEIGRAGGGGLASD